MITERGGWFVPVFVACGCLPVPLDPIETDTSAAEATAGPSSSGDTSGGAPTSTGEGETTAGPVTGETTTTGTTAADDTSTGPPAIDCTELAIEDPVLLAEVRQQLDIPDGPISGDAALAVTGIYLAGEQGVSTLAGIECLQGLVVLSLWATTVDDLAPLASLTSLRNLTLLYSGVTDLGPLAGLALENLDMSGGAFVDLGVVTEMPTLTTLSFGETNVQDLTPLVGHPGLTGVYAFNTAPLDLLPLATIPNLGVLNLDECGLTDIAALAGATKLTQLHLNGNELVEIDAIGEMTELEKLWIDDNKITSVAPLGGLKALFDVRMDRNAVGDLGPLAGATALEILLASENPLDGLDGLELLPLTWVRATNAGLKKMVAVAPTTLVSLELGGNEIVDVTPLAGHTALSGVRLDDNAITSLAPIVDAPWVVAGCVSLGVTGNPLDAVTLTDTVPAMCALNMAIQWEQGQCEPEFGMCGNSDP